MPPTPPPHNDSQIPLFYAPVLPLIRVGLRGRLPQKQIDIIFGASVRPSLFAVCAFSSGSTPRPTHNTTQHNTPHNDRQVLTALAHAGYIMGSDSSV
jgi:hypothetical protein